MLIHRRRQLAILGALAIGLILAVVGSMGRPASAGAAPTDSGSPPIKNILSDDLQRSIRLDTYRIDADSGAARGENIYFYKCWMCHNKYAESAPYLKELYRRPNLMSWVWVTAFRS